MVFGHEAFADGGISDARGFTFTCPTCGDQWGRILASPLVSGKYKQWHNITWPCLTHTERHRRGGSFFKCLTWFIYLDPRITLQRLRGAILLHEVIAIINQLEKAAQ